MEVEGVHLCLVGLRHRVNGRLYLPVGLGQVGRIQARHHAARVLADHGQRPGEEIAQIVRQIRVQSREHGVVGKGGVQAEAHLAQQKIPGGVRAVFGGQFPGPDDVAEGFGHFGRIHVPVAVHVQTPVRFQPHRLEHGGPVDGVGFQDVFGDHVLGHGPVVREQRPVRPADAGEVVDEGVEPDVGDEIRVKGQGDAPGEAAGGPGDAQVFQRLLQKGQHLVAVALRRDELRVLLDVPDQPVPVFGHAEEVVFLRDGHGLHQVVGTLAVHQLLVGEEALAAPAVQARVLAEVDVAALVHQA